jgi:hypothetical protein
MAVRSAPAAMMPPAIRLSYDVESDPERWLLDENKEPTPEGTLHDEASELLKLVLKAHVERNELDALVLRNLEQRAALAEAERAALEAEVAKLRAGGPGPGGGATRKRRR